MRSFISMSVALTILASVFTGCSKSNDENYTYPNAIVTVKTATDGSCYLQLDNNTTILPTNISSNPYGKQVRAFTYLKNMQSMVGSCTNSAEVVWLDSVLTKPAVLALDGELEWGYGFGKDPVDILNSWVTVLEDDYLTLAFRAYYNTPGNMHYVNLVYGGNPEDPYEVVFTHDANESGASYFMSSFDGVVAFDLRQIPGLISEKEAIVTVKYKSGVHGEERAIRFSYPGNGNSSVVSTSGGDYSYAKPSQGLE